MSKQRLVRAVVTRSKRPVFEAAEACLVSCWVPERKLDGEPNHPVALSTDDGSTHWHGVELDHSRSITVFLDVGDAIYAVSKDESHLSMSVIPASMASLVSRVG